MHTTERFIENANQVHNNKYIYSKTDYVRSNVKVIITCPRHGDFNILPSSHISGNGCTMCEKERRVLARIENIYGNKYDCSKITSFRGDDVVTIICPVHGEFTTTITKFVNSKQGCPTCKKEKAKKSIKLELINKYPDLIFPDDIPNHRTLIEVKCPTHGIFSKTADTLLKNDAIGCDVCFRMRELHKYFVEENKFDYTLCTSIRGIHNIAPIKCKICHTTFERKLSSHAETPYCPNCADSEALQDIIEDASILHDYKYDYSAVLSPTGIQEVFCPEHGSFETNIVQHAKNKGTMCPHCAETYRRIQSAKNFISNSQAKYGTQFIYTDVIEQAIESKYPLHHHKTKIELECSDHGKFSVSYTNHLNYDSEYGSHGGCRGCLRSLTEAKFIEDSKRVHGDRYDYSKVDYQFGNKKVTIICKEHGEFRQHPSSHSKGRRGCPKCGFSIGEAKISQILIGENLTYTYEHTFDGLIGPNGGILRYDFYVPSLNLCIEYDGKQHFKPYDRFGGVESLKRTQENDKIKNEYCEKNGINLIRVKYTLKSKNEIKKYLLDEISKISKK